MLTLTLPNGFSLQSVNHLAQNSHRRMQSNAAKSKVNYFKWAAYPDLSEGKILVLESTLLAAIAAGPIIGLHCILTISDATTSQRFDNVAITGVEIYNSFFSPSGEVGAGNRILCLSLALDRRIPPGTPLGTYGLGLDNTYFSGSHDFWSELTTYLFVSTALLTPPTLFNKYIDYFNEPIENIIAFIANSQFLTAYPRASVTPVTPSSSSGSASASSSSTNITSNYKATLTNAMFNPASVNPETVLFVDSGHTLRNISLTLTFLTSNYKFGVIELYSALGAGGVEYIGTPSNVLSNVTTMLTPEIVAYTYPFELMDLDYEYPSSSSGSGSGSGSSASGSGSPSSSAPPAGSPPALIAGYYAAFRQNCINRFSSRIHLVLQGVSAQVITNDIQRITYAYDERGFTTTLETVPWELPALNIISQSTNNLLFIAKLNQNMEASTYVVLGDIYHPMNSLTVIDKDGLVYDPLGLITRYCKGTRCYVIRTLTGDYIIVSGPCNQTTSCPTSISASSSAG